MKIKREIFNSIFGRILSFFIATAGIMILLLLANQYLLQQISEFQNSSALTAQSNTFIWVAAAFILIVGILISRLVSKKIEADITKISKHIDQMASSNFAPIDLDTPTTEQSALHHKLNNMARMLHEQHEYSETVKRDILETQDSLIKAGEEQKAIFDSASLGIALMNDRKILKCNKAFETLFGYPAKQLINTTIKNYYVDEKDFETVGTEGYDLISAGKTFTADYEFKHSKGKTFICRIFGKAINPDNMDHGTVWTFEDITERKKLANELRRNSKFQETLVNAIPIPIFYKDADAKFLVINKAYEVAMGVKRRNVIGKTVAELDIYSEEDRVKFLEEDLRIINKQLNVPKKRDITFSDGEVHKTIYWLKGFKNPDGTIGGQVGTIIDNTEQQLAQIAMEQAKELAEESSRMKSDFLANMSHEIRTPMNAIIGMSHLMLKTSLSAKQHDYQVKVQQSGQHLLGVINDILDFSKIEAGELKIENTRIKLDKIIENVYNLVAFKAREKRLNLVIEMDDKTPNEVIGDGLRISQILINYVNNAVKFTEQGGITIIIKNLAETEDTVELYFAVKDTGIGISDKEKIKLFTSFQQADTSTTRKFGGTGLGLAISKNLALLMGGSVGIDSVVGEGSTFWLQVSLNKVANTNTTQKVSANFSGQRVLVVDDNEISRKVLSDLLSDLSLRVDMASSGDQAINMTKDAANAENPYKIIFLDWHMPNMDGFETTKNIHSLGLPFETSILLVTAFGREDVIKNSATLGIESVLIKPINPELLQDTVTSILGSNSHLQPNSENDASQDHVTDMTKLAGYHVLIVEDNELNQEVAVELLKHADISSEVANNGQEALDKLANNTYDIVLMDMQMPVMDGVIATTEIRKQKQFAKLPVIAMTANVLKDDREKCLSAGMNDFLPKPIEPDDLWSMLLKWIVPRGNRVISTEASTEAAPSTSKNRLSLDNNSKIPVSIEGLDIRSGLKRVLGKEDLYLSMLNKFLSGQKNVMSEMQTSLQSSDWATLERIAHTLKGLAANIGAPHIADKASLVESAARQSNVDEVKEYLVNLSGPLENILQALSKNLVSHLDVPAEQQKQSKTNTALMKPLLEELNALLLDSDAEALELLEENNTSFDQFFGDIYISLKNHIEQFSFDEAQALIQPFLK